MPQARTLGPWSSAVELVNARERAAAARNDKIMEGARAAVEKQGKNGRCCVSECPPPPPHSPRLPCSIKLSRYGIVQLFKLPHTLLSHTLSHVFTDDVKWTPSRDPALGPRPPASRVPPLLDMSLQLLVSCAVHAACCAAPVQCSPLCCTLCRL